MLGFDVEVPAMPRPERWATWLNVSPCCGAKVVDVYPADLEQIECECGEWKVTPLGLRRADVRERVN
jgi:hypothetical protein